MPEVVVNNKRVAVTIQEEAQLRRFKVLNGTVFKAIEDDAVSPHTLRVMRRLAAAKPTMTLSEAIRVLTQASFNPASPAEVAQYHDLMEKLERRIQQQRVRRLTEAMRALTVAERRVGIQRRHVEDVAKKLGLPSPLEGKKQA